MKVGDRVRHENDPELGLTVTKIGEDVAVCRRDVPVTGRFEVECWTAICQLKYLTVIESQEQPERSPQLPLF